MLSFLYHWYQYAEVYTVMLVFVVVPLGFYCAYLVLKNHYAMFVPPPPSEESDLTHG